MAVQLIFQDMDDPCDIGLAAFQYHGCLSDIFVFGNIIEDSIIFKTDIHIKMIYLTYKQYIFSIRSDIV